jgi:hypothetical protein
MRYRCPTCTAHEDMALLTTNLKHIPTPSQLAHPTTTCRGFPTRRSLRPWAKFSDSILSHALPTVHFSPSANYACNNNRPAKRVCSMARYKEETTKINPTRMAHHITSPSRDRGPACRNCHSASDSPALFARVPEEFPPLVHPNGIPPPDSPDTRVVDGVWSSPVRGDESFAVD